MATRNIVPRGDGEGSVGTSAKKWDALWSNRLNNVDVDDLIAKVNDLGDSAIVAKSLGTNGYIKYASGLIVQWGTWTINTGAAQGKYFPIQFASTNYQVVCQSKVNNFTPPSVYSKEEYYANMIANVSAEYDYIAIGY